MPGLCNVCHGGEPKALENGVYPNLGNTNTQWLPWDLDTLVYDTVDPALSRAAQEPQFKKFNQAVLATYPQPTTVTWTGSVAIPDNDVNGVTIPLTVSGVKGPINQVILSFDGNATTPGIAHPNSADIQIQLIAPNGRSVIICYGGGVNTPSPALGANLRNVYFSEDAEVPWFDRARSDLIRHPKGTRPAEYRGTYMPDGGDKLGRFNGLDPNGIWQVIVKDGGGGTTGTGTVNQWSLHFNGTPDAAYLPAPVELIRGWYGGASAANPTPNPTFNSQFVAKGWQVPAVSVNGQILNPSDLYLQVMGPTCRACHAQRGNMRRNEIDFASYDKFIGVYGKQIASLVYDKGLMPLARRTYQNHFWAKNGSTINPPAALLAKFLGINANTHQPGFPVADAGPDLMAIGFSAVPLGIPATLNGKGSVFATGYQWTIKSKPAGSATILGGATTVTPTFTPDIEGTYVFSLTVNNAKGISAPSVTTFYASASVSPSPVSFTTHVAPQICVTSGCHFDNRGPNYVDQNSIENSAIKYRRFIERIDLNDLKNSLLVKKMNGDVPHAGNAQFTNNLMRWIYEGAPNN